MKLDSHLMKKSIFDVNYLQKFIPNKQTAKNTLVRLQKEGKIYKIRSNMYSYIKDGEILAKPYEIASKINDSSYVSHLSALAYHRGEQPSDTVYVGTIDRFNDFECMGVTYIPIVTKTLEGVSQGRKTSGIRVTTYERTVIDLIKDMDKHADYETVRELTRNCKDIDFKKMRIILKKFSNQFLCQKIGYLFQGCRNAPDYRSLERYCREHIGDSKRYITKTINDRKFVGDRNLIVPKSEVDINKL